ncbi:MAG: cyclase family protein [Thermoleophilia bacterium]|nr:cyclase family protein [Thermoleophilia bacterium]
MPESLPSGAPPPGFRVIDLTQPLSPATPMWPGSAPPAAAVESDLARDGFFTRRVGMSEHTGTHLDAPAHFVAGRAGPDAIPPHRLVVPAVVLDAPGSPDGALTAAAVRADEAARGRVPAGCAVLVRTGWDRHLDDPARYVGALDFPGVAVDAAELLVARGVVGVGIDTLSVDRGAATDFPVHGRVTLPAGVWHLEGLVNLAALPHRGALLFVGVLPLVGGSGAPARVLAVLPDA